MNDTRMSLDWSYKGMRTLVAENSKLRMVVLLDKGADIIELVYKPLDLELLFHNHHGYHNPANTPVSSSSTMGSFMDYYGGGWQDVLPSAGWGVTHRGAEFGLHGETAILPWKCTIEEERGDNLVAKLEVKGIRYPYRLRKTISLSSGESKFSVHEVLENLSNQDLEFSWLQHPAFGEPIASEGSKIWIPAKEVIVDNAKASHYRLKDGTYQWPWAKTVDGKDVDLSVLPGGVAAWETACLTGISDGWYAVKSAKQDIGFALRWSQKVWPYLWFWQNYNPPDYPWYGLTRNIGLEPSSSYPTTGIEDQIKNGTALMVRGRSSMSADYVANVFTGIKEVGRVNEKGDVE